MSTAPTRGRGDRRSHSREIKISSRDQIKAQKILRNPCSFELSKSQDATKSNRKMMRCFVNFDLKDTLSLEYKNGEVKPVLNITLSRLTFFELGGC